MRTFDARFDLHRAIVVSLLFLSIAYAQTSTATLTGSVRDQSGAMIPGVTVIVTDPARGTSLSTITNEGGSYVIPALNPGTYSLGVTLPGFKSFQNDGIVLQVAQVARIDIALEVGQVGQLVDIAACMGAADVVEIDEWRLVALDRHVEAAGEKVVVDRGQPLRTFGMTAAHVVRAAIGVGVVSSRHKRVRFSVMVPGWTKRSQPSSPS